MRSFKVMLLGDVGVGKTSIAHQLVYRRFETNYKSTIGVDIFKYRGNVSPDAGASAGPHDFELAIWDTDGNLKGRISQSDYARGAHAAIVVADVSRPQSTLDATEIAERFIAAMPGRPSCMLFNKQDLLAPDAAWEVPPPVTALGVSTALISAKTAFNVAAAVEALAMVILRRTL